MVSEKSRNNAFDWKSNEDGTLCIRFKNISNTDSKNTVIFDYEYYECFTFQNDYTHCTCYRAFNIF